jgi:hypothetical protein
LIKELVQCLKNQYYRSRKSDQQPQPSNAAPPAAITTADSFGVSSHDIVLDKRVSKTYRDIMDKFFNDYVNKKYNSITETGEAILEELKNYLGTEGKFRKRAGNGFAEAGSEAVLQSKYITYHSSFL